MKLKKGDKITIIAGKDKGKKGVVDRVYAKQNTVLIPDINMYKKHVKKNEQYPSGAVIDIPRPMDASKVMLICPKCNKPTRIGKKIDGTKSYRICRKCKSALTK